MPEDLVRIPRRTRWLLLPLVSLLLLAALYPLPAARAQGVTTGNLAGIITDSAGVPVANANVVAMHLPTGTQYRAVARNSGAYSLPNVRVGGPYRVTASFIGFQPGTRENVFAALGETQRVDFRLARTVTQLGPVQVSARRDETEGARTGAATFIDPLQVATLPSVKRSTRDLIRIDPRNDGNFSFAGRNWLFNNISLDGSYFNNSFGLDDPAPGGQTNAEPVPFDAVEQVQVSIAPFDVRQGGFTGANVNTVTKSGTNEFRGSAYSYLRNDAFVGNKVSGQKVVANPDLHYNQSGASFSGPIIHNKLFFFINGEIERTREPGSNFIARRGPLTGTLPLGVSRVLADTMNLIRDRLATYGYETGPYEGYTNETNNDKLLAKLDWNVNAANTFVLRYNYLNAARDLPPHPFVLSFANTGRGPNASSLPFRNSGYRINNKLNSIAAELNSRGNRLANRLFLSYNAFRDHRDPFSAPFPTVEIGDGGVTYTTAGHEPFSIHNILDQDVLQLTNNLSFFRGSHTYTVGANFERFSFFNSFNIFRHGVFFLPASIFVGSTFSTLQEFFNATDPANPNRKNFNAMVDFAGGGPFKGELIDVGQFSLYLQDEFFATSRLTMTGGMRVDFPTYFTDPVANPYSIGLTARDENGNPEVVDQSKLPGAKPMFSPRLGFNWDVNGDQSMRVRGGTGVFTGRVPFVWVGNVISNPGANPNLTPAPGAPLRPTRKGSVLQQSFDLNAMDPDFRWPQTWTTNVAVERVLPWAMNGTVELLYAKDVNNVFMRNADLRTPVRTLPDGRPFYGGLGNNELNPDGGAGIYVIDNTNKGYSFNVTGQLRKALGNVGTAGLGYSFTNAKNALKSTEIASVLWQNQPVQGNPNRPEQSYSEFGQRHRIIGDASYVKQWSQRFRTQFGVFMEIAEGNRFAGAGGNRYSFIYTGSARDVTGDGVPDIAAGDVNGDGATNDLIYIPRTQSEIILDPLVRGAVTISPAEQWARLDAFIRQDPYLSKHRGQIAERFGLINPWYSNVDLRIQQDIALGALGRQHGFQIGLDVMNVGNLINSDWGVRKIADPSATSPLTLMRYDASGAPVFTFTGPDRTFIDDPDLLSRWRAQIGVKYFFQ
jgi:carboxypeptidase family protein